MNKTITYKKDTFFIHDYETFGTHPALDRPSQFAGIRTDQNFNPIETEKIFSCSLPNDYLPNPESVLLTEIDPINALKTGLKEYKFAQCIQKIFNTPKTCILGYNNIRFDNEFSRHIFYRNFYDPYSWSWKHENSNWDLLHIIKAFYVLRPEGIKWPLNKNGFPSFRLQDLTKSNNIEHNNAHNALSDVYATLKLAKLMKSTQPKLFNYLYYYRTKKQLKTLIDFKNMTPLLYIPIITTRNKSIIIWITPIAWHPNNPNILIVCNLNKNLEMLWKLDTKFLEDQLIAPYNKKIEKILKLIHINKCPILIPINSLRHQDIFRLNVDPEYCLNNLYKLKQYIPNNNDIQKIIHTIILSNSNNKNFICKSNIQTNQTHVDNQLYKSFFNKNDRQKINIINNSSQEILQKLHINFFDDRLNILFFYYRARNFPNTLNNHEKNIWIKYKKTLFTQTKLKNYSEHLNKLSILYKEDKKKSQLLQSLKTYLKYIHYSVSNIKHT